MTLRSGGLGKLPVALAASVALAWTAPAVSQQSAPVPAITLPLTADDSGEALGQRQDLPPRPPYRATPKQTQPITPPSVNVAEPTPPKSVTVPPRAAETAALPSAQGARVPPRPPWRVKLGRRANPLNPPSVPAVTPRAPSVIAAPVVEPEPEVTLLETPALPNAGFLVEGLPDYVEAPTDPLGDLLAPRRDPSAIEIAPLTPLDLPQADQPTPPGELAAVDPLDQAPEPSATARRVQPAPRQVAPEAPAGTLGTRNLGGVLEDMMEPDSVVAMVNGEAILWQSVVESARSLPEDYQNKLESVFPALLQRLVDLKLLAQEARREGIATRPEVQRKVRNFEDALLREAMLRDLLHRELSDDSIREAYEDYRAESQTRMQVKARHILLESREDAMDVIAALDAGADFAKLARKRSLGSSASRGGDLGVVDVTRMVPPFAAALSGQPIGRHSAEPVQSEFGWHVVLVEERLGERLPEFDDVAPQLRRALGRDLIENRLVDLRDQAEIEIVEPETPAVSRLGSEE